MAIPQPHHSGADLTFRRRGAHSSHKLRDRRGRRMWHVLADAQRTYNLSERLVRAVSNWRVFHGADDDVETLINLGADVNVQHGTLRPLHCACMVCDVDCLQLLLQHGARVNDKDGYGRAPLHYAVENDEECTEVLIENDADVNIGDGNLNTPLHWASYKNNTTCMRLLLEHGAAVDPKDYNSNTPLSWAASRLNPQAVSLLLEYNADATSLNNQAQTPLIRSINMSLTGLTNDLAQDRECLVLLLRATRQFSLQTLDLNSIREIHQDSYMSDLVLPLCTSPRPLQHLCRYAVRSLLGYTYLPHIVADLPLPRKMRDFLLLKL